MRINNQYSYAFAKNLSFASRLNAAIHGFENSMTHAWPKKKLGFKATNERSKDDVVILLIHMLWYIPLFPQNLSMDNEHVVMFQFEMKSLYVSNIIH
jgi:hypothetical protein